MKTRLYSLYNKMHKSSSPCALPILRVRDRLSRGGQSPRIDGKLEDYYFQTAKWDCAPPGELSTGLRGKFFNFTQQILYTRLYTILILFPVGLLLLSFIPAPVVQFIGNKLFSTPSVEKIYVQTDKSFYLPGEAIWFSVYLVGEGRHTPSEISDVVYVELIDPKGNVSAKRTLAAADGFTEGDFQLNADDAGGIYTLQAYTRWMKNFGDDFFFKKKLTVQKIVTPRVLMKLDFEKEAYGSGEEVRADFSIRNLQDEPVTDKSFDFVLQLAGKSFNRGSLTTDQLGRAMIAVELPDSLTTQDGLLNVSLNHEGFTESISRSVPIVLNRIDLQFFPEGGTFVAGLPNRVAFKALNEFGQPADVRGVILDEQERQVAKFDSFHDGMGAFNFEPEAGRQYRAVLTKPGGIQQAFLLPDVEDGGTVMQVIQVDREAVSLSIHTHEKRKIQLLAHQGDTTFFAGEFPLKAGRNSLRIPTKKAVAGTALITLLDETGVPQNERLVLINVHQQLNIELETDKESYTPGQPMDLKIRTTDEHNRPVPARLSLAMVNDRIISFADDKQDNIRSALLMSSELKGEIHEPAFYFDENEPKAAQALDYVMMTHGWRKFEWWDNAVNPDSLAFQPETIDVVSGVVMDKNKDRPIKAEIFAVELSPEKKLARTETDESGRFVIKGVNPAYELMIVARGPARYRNDMSIQLDNVFFNPDLYQHFITAIGGTKKTEFVPDFIRVEVQESDQVAMSSEPNATIGQDISLTLEEGQALSEVVVVGYGLAEKRSLTGSIVSIDAFSLRQLPHSDIASVLQGRVSGISTVVNSGPVNQRPPLFIRSISSISNDRPLIVLDGIPLADTQLDQVVQPQQIQSIEILKGPAASALYGSRGVNGVIAITSNTRKWDFNYGLSQKSLTQLVVSSKGYYQTRKFYQPRFTGKHKTGRDAFPATVYWNPDIRTDARGEAVIRFRNSDEISNFRITVEGISPYGEAGRQEHTVHTLLPLSVDTKLPPFVCFGDTLWMPMIIRNNTDRPINGTFQISIPEAFELLSTLPTAVSVPADSSLTEWIQLLVLDREGKFTVKAEFTGEEYQDERLQEVTVLPMGFPVYASLAGYDHFRQFTFEIREPIPGSLRATFTGYTNVMGELMDGIQSMIREPHGCFEQTSSSTYPNVLALDLIRTTGLEDPETEKKAMHFIKQGYKRLIGFETSRGGFEWFGRSPGHEGLTAYGLMEFHDMQKVYHGVSQQMIERTTKWLLDKRDGKGGFTYEGGAGFGSSDEVVTNAYLVYAFTEIGEGEAVRREYEKAMTEAKQSKDAYQMVLMANAALNLGETEQARTLIDELVEQMGPKGDLDLKAKHSMVYAYGNSLQVEIRALLLIALLKEQTSRTTAIARVMEYITSRRKSGGFGSTQATILALKALVLYAQRDNDNSGDGEVNVQVNQHNIASEKFRCDQPHSIRMAQLGGHFKAGRQMVSVQFSGLDHPIPYTLDLSWRSLKPDASPDCKLAIRTQLSSHALKLGETTRMDIALENKTDEHLPMSMAIVGIPAGMSVQPWQLKELQEKEVFDFYEVENNYLVLYYRAMAPHAIRTVALDLKSELPGVFRAPAGSAYLYYTPEDKDWIKGELVVVGRDVE